MAFYASRRKLRLKEPDETGELNIVPYLDIMMNLIMFMLLSMTGLSSFGVVNASSALYRKPGPPATAAAPKAPLSVLIGERGFLVSASEDQPALEIPRVGAALDFAGLARRLRELKQVHPEQTKVILRASSGVTYEVLMSTMDTCRELDGRLLFPDVSLAAP